MHTPPPAWPRLCRWNFKTEKFAEAHFNPCRFICAILSVVTYIGRPSVPIRPAIFISSRSSYAASTGIFAIVASNHILFQCTHVVSIYFEQERLAVPLELSVIHGHPGVLKVWGLDELLFARIFSEQLDFVDFFHIGQSQASCPLRRCQNRESLVIACYYILYPRITYIPSVPPISQCFGRPLLLRSLQRLLGIPTLVNSAPLGFLLRLILRSVALEVGRFSSLLVLQACIVVFFGDDVVFNQVTFFLILVIIGLLTLRTLAIAMDCLLIPALEMDTGGRSLFSHTPSSRHLHTINKRTERITTFVL